MGAVVLLVAGAARPRGLMGHTLITKACRLLAKHRILEIGPESLGIIPSIASNHAI